MTSAHLRCGLACAWLVCLFGCGVEDIVAQRALTQCLDEAACEPAMPGVCEEPAMCRAPSTLCDGSLTTPLITVGDGCTALDPVLAFRHALCSCGDFVSDHMLTVEDISPDAAEGVVRAPVAVNGNFTTTADVRVEGELYVSGNLELLEGSSAIVDSMRAETGVPACDCSATSNLSADAAGAIVPGETPAGFDPAALENVTSDATMPLSCGSYRVARIAGSTDLHMTISGHVVLLVEGDIELDAGMDVSVEEGGLFELIVLGNVRLAGVWLLQGDPGQTRVYALGDGTLDLDTETLISGPLYAPRAELVTRGAFTALGPVFVRRAAPSADVLIRYDSTLASTCD